MKVFTFNYDWPRAPKWAQFGATDSTGIAYWYEEEPEWVPDGVLLRSGKGGVWRSNGCRLLRMDGEYEAEGCAESLEERPSLLVTRLQEGMSKGEQPDSKVVAFLERNLPVTVFVTMWGLAFVALSVAFRVIAPVLIAMLPADSPYFGFGRVAVYFGVALFGGIRLPIHIAIHGPDYVFKWVVRFLGSDEENDTE